MKKLLVLSVILIFGIGFTNALASNNKRINPAKLKRIITQNYHLQPFKSIEVGGNSSVTLINGSYTAKITGHQGDLTGYKFNVVDQTLHIVAPSSFIGKTAIKIATPDLKNLTITGNAIVKAKGFKTKGLTIVTKDNASVNLDGKYIIDRISQYGNGRINIVWVDSNRLFVDSDSAGPIYLAGTTKGLGVKLTGNAFLDASYLRAKIASVFTTGNARADIFAIDKLKAFATEKSNIFYHKRIKKLTVITKDSGNVLYMSRINQ